MNPLIHKKKKEEMRKPEFRLVKKKLYLGTSSSVHRRFSRWQRSVVLLHGIQPRFDAPVVTGIPFVRQPATIGRGRLLLLLATTRRLSAITQNRGPRRRRTSGRRRRQNVQHHRVFLTRALITSR